MSGVGTRRSCREHRLAVSTFGLWREKFTGETRSMSPLAVKQDAAFVVIARLEGEPALTPSSASADTPSSSTRDRVTYRSPEFASK